MDISAYNLKEKIFVDANIFIFNALDDPKYANSSTEFLKKIERGEINGVITPFVMDEILFKILIAESSKHLDKVNIWNIKSRMKDAEFSKNIYAPVKIYKKYIMYLSLTGLEILSVYSTIVMKSVDIGEKYGLITADSIHLSTMMAYGIKNIATKDSDFEGIEDINIWTP